MKKPWSITTTLRNPDRLRNFLIVFSQLEGEQWNSETQIKFQILLIKNRMYGYGSRQFYNGLTKKQIDMIEDLTHEITFVEAKKILETKQYVDPDMRGRQSFNPLYKLGFVTIINSNISITALGKLFLKEDYDLGDIFFRSFIKWQIPNPVSNDYKVEDGYDIKPFIGVMHLINHVNTIAINRGEKPKGISKLEFSLFCPCLVNYKDIENYANQIIQLRVDQKGKSKTEQKKIFENYRIKFVEEFLGNSNIKEIQKFLNNLKDYGDNALRYFRLTRFFYTRGGDYYIDLEKRRKIEIENLLNFDKGNSIKFDTKEQYLSYIADISQPQLPWETKEEFCKIIIQLISEIKSYEIKLNLPSKRIENYTIYNTDELKKYISILRRYRRELQNEESHQKSQEINQIKNYIDQLSNIYEFDNRSILLEKLSSLSLNALNDALKIKPNFPVGDDNEPTFTAPANMADIECFYKSFNAICEVTLLRGRNQWYHEGQPVMRHLRDFEKNYDEKKSYCLFIAPTIHRDTLNTFWMAIKYEYEGRKQNIVPLTIKDLVSILKVLVEIKEKKIQLSHLQLKQLFDNIIESSKKYSDSNKWYENIPRTIKSWNNNILARLEV